jgi:hypothetical protein
MEEEAGTPATVAVYVTVPDKETGTLLPWALWVRIPRRAREVRR